MAPNSNEHREQIDTKIDKKSFQNRSKSVLGAILTENDFSLEPSWLKMTPRIDSGAFGEPNSKIMFSPECEPSFSRFQTLLNPFVQIILVTSLGAVLESLFSKEEKETCANNAAVGYAQIRGREF